MAPYGGLQCHLISTEGPKRMAPKTVRPPTALCAVIHHWGFSEWCLGAGCAKWSAGPTNPRSDDCLNSCPPMASPLPLISETSARPPGSFGKKSYIDFRCARKVVPQSDVAAQAPAPRLNLPSRFFRGMSVTWRNADLNPPACQSLTRGVPRHGRGGVSIR